MSQSMHVIGFTPRDGMYNKMKSVWDACDQAGIEPPSEVYKFFNYENPSDVGMKVDISSAVQGYSADMEKGFEVDISKLPKNVTVIRFYNSY